MWPDMHSFYRFHTFEPIDFLLFSLRKVDHVLRFTDFTVSNCSTFYRFHKFGLILARICEFHKTSNQKLITWVILVRGLSSQNRIYEIKNMWTWDESENVNKTRNRWQMGVGDIYLLMQLKIISILLDWILPFLIELRSQDLWHKYIQRCFAIEIYRFYEQNLKTPIYFLLIWNENNTKLHR